MKRALGWGCALAPLMLLATVVWRNMTLCFDRDNPIWTARVDLVGITSALDQYALLNEGRFPASLVELTVPDDSGESLLDQNAAPVDPWGRVYVYRPAADRLSFQLLTLGEDGLAGGEGRAADISHEDVPRRGRSSRHAGKIERPADVVGEPFSVPETDHAAPLRVDQPPPSEQPE